MAESHPKPTGRKIKNIAGIKFGRWTALYFIGASKSGSVWMCRCDCGKEKSVRSDGLCNGSSKSCGCLTIDTARQKTIHSHSKRGSVTPEYAAWKQMIQRCHNPKSGSYAQYGSRGISVCDQWRASFHEFIAHIGPRPSKDHSVDRIDNNGNYEPGNVRWATIKEQNCNTSRTRLFEFNGDKLCIEEISRRSGTPSSTIRRRLSRGMTIHEASATHG